jgi:enediyne biosynthesis protein E4
MTIHKVILLLLTAACWVSCSSKKTLFELLPASQTGIDFINQIEENDTINVLNYMNIYTGAGVAAGDINNDGLTDLYFSGNQTSGKLYLNKGDFKFEDITKKAGLLTNRWCTGVSFVDINQDGFLDIYVNVAGSPKFGSTANLLFINHKNNTFTEEAAKYGIADTRLTMNASFFDYDGDEDLDLFLITNPADERVSYVNTITQTDTTKQVPGVDILYRNNGNGSFTDVSEQAGITKGGYSLGAAISDLNNDGYPDIYITNDFLSSDILYINNGNGSFTDKIKTYLKHSSFASMGCDVADFNNDGLTDIYTLDMLPEDNFRKKMIIPAASYDRFQLLLQSGYEPQYTRNNLQLNNGDGSFSDIAFMAGVSSTDWSWATLFADYDNDGDKDLLVTNGFYRDLGNLDYINYQSRLNSPMGNQVAKRSQKLKAIKDLAKIPLQGYLFENNNNLSFTKRSTEWGIGQPGFSNGACYADLDNDGDPELIINQFNDVAKIYRNDAEKLRANNYISIQLQSHSPNLQAVGAKVFIYTSDSMQMQEMSPYRGFESSVDPVLHFGTGQHKTIDSIKVIWPNGKTDLKKNISANQRLTINYSQDNDILPKQPAAQNAEINRAFLFTEITGEQGLNYYHIENEFVDFKIQPLLPHMHSRLGPGLATADINKDGLTDLYAGAGAGYAGCFFIQNKAGDFTKKSFSKDSSSEDMGTLFFDADNDGDADLYVVSGSSEFSPASNSLQDRLYINDGEGNFENRPNTLPNTASAGSCVVANDYDKDGDLDLFVGGRISPGSYPLSPQSYLLKNQQGVFVDSSATGLPLSGEIGMVTAALWTDYNNDGWTDLMITGEFMSVMFIKNEFGKLNINSPLILPHSSGWWNSITAADFDKDGDIDYVVGNLGLNSRHHASPKEPLCVYAKDYDKNGRIDPIMCYYVQGKNYIYPSRDEVIKQMPAARGRFPTYKDFASVSFEEAFTSDELKEATIVKADCMESSYFENKGEGVFERKALPLLCQTSPIFGMLTGDYNSDGNVDILITGNSNSTEPSTGAYDAMNGILVVGDGKGNFAAQNAKQTGFRTPGDMKGIASLKKADGSLLVLAMANSGQLQTFRYNLPGQAFYEVGSTSDYAIITLKNGKKSKQEFYWGNAYLSSSGRLVWYDQQNTKMIEFYDAQGNRTQMIAK